jgi:hypothetical protein
MLAPFAKQDNNKFKIEFEMKKRFIWPIIFSLSFFQRKKGR